MNLLYALIGKLINAHASKKESACGGDTIMSMYISKQVISVQSQARLSY